MNKLAFIFTVLVSTIGLAKDGPSNEMVANEHDIRIMLCNVDFRPKGGIAFRQIQNNGGVLPVTNGKKELQSLGDVKIILSKASKGDFTKFSLSITQGKEVIGSLTTSHRSFEYTTPIELHVDDIEDGQNYDQVRVTCEASLAVG